MKLLLIIAQNEYHDLEYSDTKKELEQAGFEIVTASTQAGKCKGKLGGTTTATISIGEINIEEYSAIIFIGGRGAIEYQNDPFAHMTAQEAITENKVVAAICIAPTILAKAGILEGKKATVWNKDGTGQKILEENGAIFTGQAVTIDGKMITAN